MSDDFDLNDAEGLDYPDKTDTSVVVVEDGDEFHIYTEGQDCSMCWRDSIGVVIVFDDGDKHHKPVCDEHLEEIRENDGLDKFELRKYD